MLKTLKMSAILLTLLLFACNDEKPNTTPVVATSGSAQLHLDELHNMIPQHPSLLLSSAQVQNLIQRWVEEELVYQQALSEDFDKIPEVKEKIYEQVKNYLVALYLKDKVDAVIEVTEEEIQSYYDSNSSEFIRPFNYYNVKLMLANSYAKANELRRLVTTGESFESVARENSLDAEKENGGVLGWVTLDQLPSELASRVRNMTPNTMSRPIRTVVGHYIVQLDGIRKKDEIQTLEEVFDVLNYRIKARKREENYRQLINQLKENSNVTINWSFIDSLNVIK